MMIMMMMVMMIMMVMNNNDDDDDDESEYGWIDRALLKCDFTLIFLQSSSSLSSSVSHQ